MYHHANDLIKACHDFSMTLSEATLARESEETGQSVEEIRRGLADVWQVMEASATEAASTPTYALSGLTGGNAPKVQAYAQTEPYCGHIVTQGMAHALSVSECNANMGRIVAAPTAGASGIVPAALLTAKRRFDLSDENIIDALVVASAVGGIIATNATVSGAEGGCQVECGSAAAMAAAALVYLRDGSPESAFEAASFALISVMGLVCDPIGGLVEFPCALRNASGVVNALSSADLALAGVLSVVPFDEVVEAMYLVGQALPYTLRETALGGLAVTPSAINACAACAKR